MEYNANAGQTYMPFRENVRMPTLAYTPLPMPAASLLGILAKTGFEVYNFYDIPKTERKLQHENRGYL